MVARDSKGRDYSSQNTSICISDLNCALLLHCDSLDFPEQTFQSCCLASLCENNLGWIAALLQSTPGQKVDYNGKCSSSSCAAPQAYHQSEFLKDGGTAAMTNHSSIQGLMEHTHHAAYAIRRHKGFSANQVSMKTIPPVVVPIITAV